MSQAAITYYSLYYVSQHQKPHPYIILQESVHSRHLLFDSRFIELLRGKVKRMMVSLRQMSHVRRDSQEGTNISLSTAYIQQHDHQIEAKATTLSGLSQECLLQTTLTRVTTDISQKCHFLTVMPKVTWQPVQTITELTSTPKYTPTTSIWISLIHTTKSAGAQYQTVSARARIKQS